MRYYCCSGRTKQERVVFAMRIFELGKTVLIKGIPAHVCRQCGEQSFDLEVAQNLEALRELTRREQLPTRVEENVASAEYAVLA